MGLAARRAGVAMAAAIAAVSSLPGCGSNATSSAPTTWSYFIDFQSKDAAVSVDTLEISLFDANAGGCALLVSKRRGDEDLAPIASSEAVSVCDVLHREAETLRTSYGSLSVLVVAKKGDQPILIGCSEQSAGPAQGEPPVVMLTNFDETVSIKPSTCASVAAYCDHAC